MSEPITLYRGEEVMTVYAPSEAQRLMTQEGWHNEQRQETEGQGQAERDSQGREEGGQEVECPAAPVLPDDDEPDLSVGGEYSVNPGAPLEAIPSVARKAGRPKKAQ